MRGWKFGAALLALVVVMGLLPGMVDPGSLPGDPHPAAGDCTSCHRMPGHQSHPVGVPSPRVEGLPLDARDRLACTTCHEDVPHDRGARRGSLLRRPADLLCTSCHEAARPGSRAYHAQVLGEAHGGAERKGRAGIGLDRLSERCLECHDGVTARASGIRVGPRLSRRGRGMEEHPVGIPYGAFSPGSRLRPALALPHEVRLFGGTVGCGSCHSAYSSLPDMLVMSNTGSRLCSTCHEL